MRRPGETYIDVADIATRVFFERFKVFKYHVLDKGKLGHVRAYAFSVELQQRG